MLESTLNHRRSKLIFLILVFIFIIFVFGIYVINRSRKNYGEIAYDYLEQLAGMDGIGARAVLSAELDMTEEWIKTKLSDMGYQVFVEYYDDDIMVADDRQFVHTRLTNIWIEIPGTKSNDLIILSANYSTHATDSKSRGAVSNGSGVVVLLTVAEEILKQDLQLAYRTRILFSPNLDGARTHSLNMQKSKRNEGYEILGAVVLDSVIGGDKIYVHSPMSIPLPEKLNEYDSMDWIYRLGQYQDHNASTVVRDSLLQHSEVITNESMTKHKLIMHGGFGKVEPGQSKDWSSIVAFYRLGIPSAHIESTNFDIISHQNYRDGYSQTTNDNFWNSGFCKDIMTACDKNTEKNWGRIWRTDFDNLNVLESYMPGLLKEQLQILVAIMLSFVEDPF